MLFRSAEFFRTESYCAALCCRAGESESGKPAPCSFGGCGTAPADERLPPAPQGPSPAYTHARLPAKQGYCLPSAAKRSPGAPPQLAAASAMPLLIQKSLVYSVNKRNLAGRLCPPYKKHRTDTAAYRAAQARHPAAMRQVHRKTSAPIRTARVRSDLWGKPARLCHAAFRRALPGRRARPKRRRYPLTAQIDRSLRASRGSNQIHLFSLSPASAECGAEPRGQAARRAFSLCGRIRMIRCYSVVRNG